MIGSPVLGGRGGTVIYPLFGVTEDIAKGTLFKISKDGQLIKYKLDSYDIADGIAMRDLRHGDLVHFGPEGLVVDERAEDVCKPIIVEGR